jgi:hypothetical protein
MYGSLAGVKRTGVRAETAARSSGESTVKASGRCAAGLTDSDVVEDAGVVMFNGWMVETPRSKSVI